MMDGGVSHARQSSVYEIQPHSAGRNLRPGADTPADALSGDVPSPLQLTAEDLARLPRVTVSVQEQDGAKIQYEGVALRDVLAKAGAPLGKELRGKALASYILAKGPLRV